MAARDRCRRSNSEHSIGTKKKAAHHSVGAALMRLGGYRCHRRGQEPAEDRVFVRTWGPVWVLQVRHCWVGWWLCPAANVRPTLQSAWLLAACKQKGQDRHREPTELQPLPCCGIGPPSGLAPYTACSRLPCRPMPFWPLPRRPLQLLRVTAVAAWLQRMNTRQPYKAPASKSEKNATC